MSAELPSVRARCGAFRVWRRDTPEAEAALCELLPDPDRALVHGEELPSLWRGAATSKLRVRLGERDYFLKRYNCSGWPYRLKNALRSSRALRAWQAVEHFLSRGVPTPVPLLCLEERRLRLLERAYLLFPFIGGEEGNLLDLWPTLDPVQRRGCLAKLGTIIGGMHRQGLLHGDLNWRNILVARAGEAFHFWLVDLDGSRVVAKPDADLAVADLYHFSRDMDRAQLDDALRMVFLASWQNVSGWKGVTVVPSGKIARNGTRIRSN